MKKVIIFIAVIAFLSFSCNKYCRCDSYVDGKKDKSYKPEFIYEDAECKDYSEPLKEIDGITYEIKCK